MKIKHPIQRKFVLFCGVFCVADAFAGWWDLASAVCLALGVLLLLLFVEGNIERE